MQQQKKAKSSQIKKYQEGPKEISKSKQIHKKKGNNLSGKKQQKMGEKVGKSAINVTVKNGGRGGAKKVKRKK